MPKETYKQARIRLLNNLAALGWDVKPSQKVPTAISPDRTIKLFFKPQAIHTTNPLGIHSINVDMRDANTQHILDTVERMQRVF